MEIPDGRILLSWLPRVERKARSPRAGQRFYQAKELIPIFDSKSELATVKISDGLREDGQQ
jgi:hypothetical protein